MISGKQIFCFTVKICLTVKGGKVIKDFVEDFSDISCAFTIPPHFNPIVVYYRRFTKGFHVKNRRNFDNLVQIWSNKITFNRRILIFVANLQISCIESCIKNYPSYEVFSSRRPHIFLRTPKCFKYVVHSTTFYTGRSVANSKNNFFRFTAF